MVRSNSFDLTQNRAKKRLRQEKISDADFEIINFEDFEKIKTINYNVQQLKKIAKYYKVKQSGNKTELKDRLYEHLKGSSFAIKIQKIIRIFFVKRLIIYKGPGLLDRKKCNNSKDFYSFEDLDEIKFEDFFSYKDVDGFIYGFTNFSINELLKNENSTNPYNRQIVSKQVKKSLKRIKKLSKILNIKYDCTNSDEDNDVTQTLEQLNRAKLIELFQVIDNYGHITNLDWFLNLDRVKLILFMRELKDIFFYRANLSRNVQREIIPMGDPFPNIPWQELFINYSLHFLRKKVLGIIEKFITTGVNESSRSVGVYYVLSTFTICSRSAAQTMPWLYEAVMHNQPL